MAQMPNFLNSIKMQRPPRNQFDMSYDVKTTFDMGELIPVCCTEVLPGDSWRIGGNALVRFAPLIAPVMQRMKSRIHYFFVPNRVLYDEWDNFISGSSSVAAPYVTVNAERYSANPLFDYLNLPDPGSTTYTASAFPFAAYQMIYNEYYRDQNLQTPVNYNLIPGDQAGDTPDLWTLRNCAWDHDLFTSALPSEQFGASVDIPLGQGVVTYNADAPQVGQWRPSGGGAGFASGDLAANVTGNTVVSGGSGDTFDYDPKGTLVTDLEPTTINSLRRAFSLQRWAETAMRVGRRLVEVTLGHFGVKSSDARLQRPEYIVGVNQPVIISEVLNTTGEIAEGGLPQGNMSGHGISVARGNFGSYFAEEHGWIIGVMSVLPETSYSQGIPNHFLRFDKFDYYWPELANIGEAAVPNKEVFVQSAEPDAPFGYMPQYYGYRFNQSRVSGQMKTTYDYWHFGRKFDEEPALNADFIECRPTKNPFAVQDPGVDSLIVHVVNNMSASRLVNKFGTPI